MAEAVWDGGLTTWDSGASVWDTVAEAVAAVVGGVGRARRRIIYEPLEEVEQEEIKPVTKKEVKRIIVRKIKNKEVAKQVQAKIDEIMPINPISLDEFNVLIVQLKQQETAALKLKRQLKDDEEAIRWLI